MRARRALLLLSLAAGAQQPQPQVKFTAAANLVIVNVTVEDRAGHTIEGLKKEEFTVLEDGKPQAIAVFDFQRLTLEPLPSAPPPLPPGLGVSPPPAAQQPPPEPGKSPYQNRRLLVLFFDFSGMSPSEQMRAQDAALKFLQEQMTAADLVSIMSFSSRLRVDQDFTDDREALGEVIRAFRIGEMADLVAEPAEEEAEDDPGALLIADETEFNIFNTDRRLSALETTVRKLAALPEKKALIYFSSGAGKTGAENQSQLLATVNAAVRANVAFYPLDARGLLPLPPGGDATRASPRGTAIFSGKAQREQRRRHSDQQETLYTLAAETGGKALLDSNDLLPGMVQAQRDLRSYYILGYYSINPAQDGRFRRLQVRLAGNRQARLEYRPGYFGPKEYRYFTGADKERQLEEALVAGDPTTGLPLALEVDYFRLRGGQYFVPVAVKIPGSEVAPSAELDFIGQVRDEKNRLVASVRDRIEVKLGDERLRRHLHYDAGFALPPGAYRIKFLARENRTGRMGTFETGFTVPNLDAQSQAPRLSSVIWSHQREPVSAAVGRAEKKSPLLKFHPLVQEGKQLIPSITRVFRRSQNLHVYFEVYDPAADPATQAVNVAATLSIFRERVKVLEPGPLRLTQFSPSRPGALTFEFQVPLAQLPPGRYTCQVSVIDEVARQFAFVRAPLVVLR